MTMMKTPTNDQGALRGSIDTLTDWIARTPAGGLVFFGGAGVSTESGIPDFRSKDGLYRQKFPYPPEQIISRSFFDAKPDEFFRFYFERMMPAGGKPNACHRKLAELEKSGTLSCVITQNIDGLHQDAGSESVLELHGSIHRNHCMSCGKAYDLEETIALHEASDDGVPRCTSCGDIVKPDVVLYEEALDSDVLRAAATAVARADLMIVAGTSLVVYPAAGLLQLFRGSHLVIVNLTPTEGDAAADLCIAARVGEVFSAIDV